MKRTTKLTSLVVLLSLAFLPIASARAAGPFDGGPVIFGGNYTLKRGETLNGDLVVFGGNVAIEEDALVKGSIVIFGGNIALDGAISGDLVLIGGVASLGPKSLIEGDLASVGGTVSRAEGSRVEGRIRQEPAIEIPIPPLPQATETPPLPTLPETSAAPDFSGFKRLLAPLGSALGALTQAILMAALAMLLSLFLRPQMERVAQTFRRQPLTAGGVGLLAALAFPLLVVLMAVTIIFIVGIPFAILALVLAWLFGVVSIGLEVGERFTRAVEQTWPSVWTAGFGTFLLVLAAEGIGMIPCVGWLAPFLLGTTGIGAVLIAAAEAKRSPSAVPPLREPPYLSS